MMRRFSAPEEVVIGYDETSFPKAAVEAVRSSWRRVAPARTMPFLRSDAAAPAAVLVSFGRFATAADAIARFDDVAGEGWRDARAHLVALIAASRKPAPELQFRFDVGARIIRGRFHPDPSQVDAALRGLAAFARALDGDAAEHRLPDAVRIVTAAWDGSGWRRDEARGYERARTDDARGRSVRLRHADGRWSPS